MSFLGGLFSGGGGQQTNSSTSSSSQFNPDPAYLKFARDSMANAERLRDAPFEAYDVSKFGPMSNATQKAGWDQLTAANGSWNPYFSNANNVYARAAGIDPTAAGKPAYDRAMATPTSLDAANPWVQKAGQSWGDVSSQYMNPYINDVIKNSSQLQSQNFLQNVLPGLSNTFVASGGGLGGKNYGKDMNWALTNFNDSLGRTNTGALSDEWNKAAGIFGVDASRFSGLANTVGQQAAADRAGFTTLGQAQGANANNSIASLSGLAGGFANLGNQQLNNQITSANATLAAGNQQQAIEDWKNNFNYQQFQQGKQWPYQTNSWAADVVNKYQWPYSTSSQSNTQQTSSANSSASPFSSLLGTLATVGSLAIPGASGTSAGGNILSGIFGSGGASAGGAMFSPTPNMTGWTGGGSWTPGSGPGTGYSFTAKRGGSFDAVKRRGPKRGIFAYGGQVHEDEAQDRAMIRAAVHKHERALHPGEPLTQMRRGGYLGMNAPSSPVFNYNPAYIKFMEPAAFSQGGEVGPTLGKLLGSIAGGFFGGPIGAGLGGMAGGFLGDLLPFATGGNVPVVRAARASNDRRMNAIRSRPQRPQGVTRDLALPSPNSGYFNG